MRKCRVIMPSRKQYAYQDAPKVCVAAYCRVSTHEEKQVSSFEAQVERFSSLIENNPRYELVDIYQDDGISGTTINKRKDFQRVIDDAVAGKIDLILTKSISRFGRNIMDILNTLEMLGNLTPPVAVNFERENIFSSDGNNKLLISILSALAELESQQKSIAIKDGIRYRMKEGLYRFSVQNTIGYYRDYLGQVKIEPAEAEIVRYIYDSFLEGVSPQEIADALTRQGIRSPRGLDTWRGSTIRGILANEKYCGDVLYQKTYSKDFKTHKSAKNDAVLPQWYWEDAHPAIIKRRKWITAQELLAVGKWSRRHIPIAAMKKKFTVVRVKNGVLRGYFLLHMNWTKEEREQFNSIMYSINEIEEREA